MGIWQVNDGRNSLRCDGIGDVLHDLLGHGIGLRRVVEQVLVLIQLLTGPDQLVNRHPGLQGLVDQVPTV